MLRDRRLLFDGHHPLATQNWPTRRDADVANITLPRGAQFWRISAAVPFNRPTFIQLGAIVIGYFHMSLDLSSDTPVS
jgi:hypothetical protein